MYPVFLEDMLVLLSHVVDSGLPQVYLYVLFSFFVNLPTLLPLLQSPTSLILSFLPFAPVLSSPCPAAPVSAQCCWLEPMLHLAFPLRPWGHTWRAKALRASTQARLPWSGGLERRRMSKGCRLEEDLLKYSAYMLTHCTSSKDSIPA